MNSVDESRVPFNVSNPNYCPSCLLLGGTVKGSEFKIDASYLSPNVNLAARLEAATKQFGVPLLLRRVRAFGLEST